MAACNVYRFLLREGHIALLMNSLTTNIILFTAILRNQKFLFQGNDAIITHQEKKKTQMDFYAQETQFWPLSSSRVKVFTAVFNI